MLVAYWMYESGEGTSVLLFGAGLASIVATILLGNFEQVSTRMLARSLLAGALFSHAAWSLGILRKRSEWTSHIRHACEKGFHDGASSDLQALLDVLPVTHDVQAVLTSTLQAIQHNAEPMRRLNELRGIQTDEAALQQYLCLTALSNATLDSLPVLISLALSLGSCAMLLEAYALFLELTGGESPFAPEGDERVRKKRAKKHQHTD